MPSLFVLNLAVAPRAGCVSRPMRAGRAASKFDLAHVGWPLLAFAVLVVVLMPLGGDRWLADRVYAMQGGRWALRNAFVTDALIHRLGRNVAIAAWLGVLACWIASLRIASWRHLRAPLAYLLTSTLLAMACVAWIKSWSNMDCPWDLLSYGGDRPYVELWAVRPLGLERGRCFPAGHASGGYAWLALYFFFGVVRPRWRWFGLAVGAGSGLLLGVSQQLRGAHFASHDVFTAAICWAVALAMYRLFLPRMIQARWHAAGFERGDGR